MNRIKSFIRALFASVWGIFKRHPRTSVIVIVIIVAGLGYTLLGNKKAEAPTDVTTVPTVTLATVASLSSETTPRTLLGEVRSQSEAELRAEKSGQVTRVYVKAGQYVAPGSVLAEIENQSERASVLQAQGALAAAEATLAKVRGGARSEDKASATSQAQSAVVTLLAAQDGARTAYGGAYSAAQDAVLSKTDSFFSNAYTVRPSFRIHTATYDESRALEAERVALGELLVTWNKKQATSVPDADLASALRTSQSNLSRIKTFLDTISGFVAEQTTVDVSASEKATQEALLAAARAEVSGAQQGVAGALQGLASAQSAQEVTSQTESKLVVGAQREDIQAAQAAVTQARGALAGAQAFLEKSLVRTPIGGTVSTLALRQGDYVTPGTVLAVVANKRALEVEASVSDDVRSAITVGSKVRIEGRYAGVVTSIEPGLDPVTKKARVHIGISDTAETLTNGAYVSVTLSDTTGTSQKITARDGFTIPVQAIKVLPDGLALFTVSASSTLEAYPIKEGPISGDTMLVKDDSIPEMLIVTDVRGLSVGETVRVSGTTNK